MADYEPTGALWGTVLIVALIIIAVVGLIIWLYPSSSATQQSTGQPQTNQYNILPITVPNSTSTLYP